MRFAGRAGIVTGGSSGIGRAIAGRLAGEGAGLVLVAAPDDATDLDAALEELRTAGADVDGFAADIGEPETADRAVALARERIGRLDAVASNAGIAYFEDVLEAPLAHLDRTWHVNVRGMYLMCVAAARAMAKQGGAIVCTASTASYVGEELQVTYNASKGAVAQLARSLAVDLAPRRIRVNAVAPGWVRTRATEAIVVDEAEWAKHRTHIPLDRAADPAEIAAAAAFLLSDDASYVTGAVLHVDGGMTAGFRFTDWDAVPRAVEPRA